jgi:DNA polymerase III subunit epsilon
VLHVGCSSGWRWTSCVDGPVVTNWLDRWRGARAVQPALPGRWIVLDVESNGLDARRDALLAIAAVAVRVDPEPAAIVLADSFDAVIHYDPGNAAPDRENILLHGIGVARQRAGQPQGAVLAAFEAWAAGSPLIAFHAAFDRTMIDRARRAEALAALANPWLDLEPLAAVLRPNLKARSLDEWMAALGLHCAQRHQAAADTFATAELLLRLLPALRRETGRGGGLDFAAAQRLAAQRRWMP